MELAELLAVLPPPTRVLGAMQGTCLAIATDSRHITPGSLFIGLPGAQVDGGTFWPQVRDRALAALISEEAWAATAVAEPQMAIATWPQALLAEVCALTAAWFYDQPARKLKLVGVTGTNGKTTTTHLIEHIMQTAGQPVALLGTLNNRWPGYSEPAHHTTAFAVDLQRNLAAAVAAGCQTAILEVSSHALAQGRVAGCPFAVAVWTNFSQDHLDFHGSMAAYWQAKALLFEPPLLTGQAILNADDSAVCQLLDTWPPELPQPWTFGHSKTVKGQSQAITTQAATYSANGIEATISTPSGLLSFQTPLVGAFNLSNCLAAIATTLALGIDPATIATALAHFTGVPGRMMSVQAGQDFAIIIDYAHTPDGLENVLTAVRPMTAGRLICLFGCGGDRDRRKRPLMGAIATRLADYVIVTADNPRTEDPGQIIDDILAGIAEQTESMPVRPDIDVIADRRAAIVRAIQSAQAGDTVVLAGKGHEDYQIIGSHKIHFDDCEEALAALSTP